MNKIVIGVGAVAAYAINKRKEESRKYTQILGQPEEKEEDSVSDKIKEAAAKKASEVIMFVVENQEKIEAVGTVIGSAGTVIGVVNGVRDYNKSDKIETML